MPKVIRSTKSASELEAYLLKMSKRQAVKYNKSREWNIRWAKSELAMVVQEDSLPANLDPINPNRRENLFAKSAKLDGWTVTKRGWPDYLCWKDGNIIAVEVKPDRENLTPHQKLLVAKLKEAGIKCFLWQPTPGLQPL